jgi:hypothetical protein
VESRSGSSGQSHPIPSYRFSRFPSTEQHTVEVAAPCPPPPLPPTATRPLRQREHRPFARLSRIARIRAPVTIKRPRRLGNRSVVLRGRNPHSTNRSPLGAKLLGPSSRRKRTFSLEFKPPPRAHLLCRSAPPTPRARHSTLLFGKRTKLSSRDRETETERERERERERESE